MTGRPPEEEFGDASVNPGGAADPDLPLPHPDVGDPDLPLPHPDVASPDLPLPHPDVADGGGLFGSLTGTLALIVASGLVLGAILGLTVFADDDESGHEIASAAAVVRALDCPGGEVLAEVFGGDRVYAVGQDESGAWRAIRDPRDTRRLMWVPAVALDEDSEFDLPVVECPAEATVTIIPPEAVTTTSEAGTTTTTSPSVTTTSASGTTTTTSTTVPQDTSAPEIVGLGVSEGVIFGGEYEVACNVSSEILVGVQDDVGVVSVVGNYEELPDSPLIFVHIGSSVWEAEFGPFFDLAGTFEEDVTITIIASDAAGNTDSVLVIIKVFGGSCVR